jgi:hypothetical protein
VRVCKPRYATGAAIAFLIAVSALISLAYAISVPPFMMPDEVAHADYAFAFFDAGKPFRLHSSSPSNYVTPQTRYLIDDARYRKLRYNIYATVAVTHYGVRTRAEPSAPLRSLVPPRDGAPVPYAMLSYPPVYYAVVSSAMSVAYGITNHTIVAAFYAGRLTNIAYLVLTLIAVSGLLGELPLTSTQRIALFVAIALFPMTQWMSSYVQPDNATALLVTLCAYLTIKLRATARPLLVIAALSSLQCLLAFTKLHYALVVTVAIAPTHAPWFRRSSATTRAIGIIALGVVPVVAMIIVPHVLPAGQFRGSTVDEAFRGNAASSARLFITNIAETIVSVFFGGQTFESFWFHVGIRAASAFGEWKPIAAVLNALVVAGTLLTVVAFAIARIRIARRLCALARRRGIVRALDFVASDVNLNLYAILTVLLLGLSAAANGLLELQGRYWYPVLTSIFFLSVRSLGGAVRRSHRRRAETGYCLILATLAIVLAPATFIAMHDDFYTSRPDHPTHELGEISHVFVDERPQIGEPVEMRASSTLRITGVAMDSSLGEPAAIVRYRIDGRDAGPVATRLADDRLARIFNDPRLDRSGFSVRVDTRSLLPGDHVIVLDAIETRAHDGVPIASRRITVER